LANLLQGGDRGGQHVIFNTGSGGFTGISFPAKQIFKKQRFEVI